MDFLTYTNVALAVIVICLLGIWFKCSVIASNIYALAQFEIARFNGQPTDVRIVSHRCDGSDWNYLRVNVINDVFVQERSPDSTDEWD